MARLTNQKKLNQQIALRLLVDLDALSLSFANPWNDIDNAFALTNCKCDVEDATIKEALPLIKAKHKQVFAKQTKPSTYQTVFGKWLKSNFALDDLSYDILFIVHAIRHSRRLAEFANAIGDVADSGCIDILATITQQPPFQIAKRLKISSPLLRHNLIKIQKSCNEFTRKIYPTEIVETYLADPYFDHKNLLTGFLSHVSKARLDIKAFPKISKDIDWITTLLNHHKEQPFSGYNILLYGAPGTGKTQLSRLLAKQAKLDCFEVNFADKRGDQLEGSERLEKLVLVRDFINPQGNVIVFDELEDAIPSDSFFGMNGGPKKRWFNELLETNKVPVIWISNSVNHLDPAFLRRFDYCLKVSAPTTEQKLSMLNDSLQLESTTSWVKNLAENPHITPADIERAQFVFKATQIKDEDHKHHYFNNMLKARGKTLKSNKQQNTPEYVSELAFSPKLSNTNICLSNISKIVENNNEGRFLLHGVPGTGKTGYVHYLANKLSKPLVSKSASDLLGSYVGQNEKAIRKMFAEATSKNAILLLDEADSFFSERKGHESEWRTSMVNEMLVQLERFNGVFFASTNLPEGLDLAIKRRFDFHVAFDYLSKQQIIDMSTKVLQLECAEPIAHFCELTNVTPADFSLATRQARLQQIELTQASLYEVLQQQSLQRNPNSQRIGFL